MSEPKPEIILGYECYGVDPNSLIEVENCSPEQFNLLLKDFWIRNPDWNGVS